MGVVRSWPTLASGSLKTSPDGSTSMRPASIATSAGRRPRATSSGKTRSAIASSCASPRTPPRRRPASRPWRNAPSRRSATTARSEAGPELHPRVRPRPGTCPGLGLLSSRTGSASGPDSILQDQLLPTVPGRGGVDVGQDRFGLDLGAFAAEEARGDGAFDEGEGLLDEVGLDDQQVAGLEGLQCELDSVKLAAGLGD